MGAALPGGPSAHTRAHYGSDVAAVLRTRRPAARNGHPSESWEHVMSWGTPTEQQHRPAGAGAGIPADGGRA